MFSVRFWVLEKDQQRHKSDKNERILFLILVKKNLVYILKKFLKNHIKYDLFLLLAFESRKRTMKRINLVKNKRNLILILLRKNLIWTCESLKRSFNEINSVKKNKERPFIYFKFIFSPCTGVFILLFLFYAFESWKRTFIEIYLEKNKRNLFFVLVRRFYLIPIFELF